VSYKTSIFVSNCVDIRDNLPLFSNDIINWSAEYPYSLSLT